MKEYLKLPYLWDAGDAPFDINCYTWDYDDKATKLMEIIEKEEDKADALIFVSHKDISVHIAELIMGKYGITSVDNIKLDEGHAVHINLETKTYQIIPE